MREYLTEAIILDKEDWQEADWRIFMYTKELGRISARATGARKILSKLNAHLEPLTVSKVRLVQKNNFQIVDAIAVRRLPIGNSPLLGYIKEMTFEDQGDYHLWNVISKVLESDKPSFVPLLIAMGLDPQLALCQTCQGRPDCFDAKEFSFFCSNCLPQDHCLMKYA